MNNVLLSDEEHQKISKVINDARFDVTAARRRSLTGTLQHHRYLLLHILQRSQPVISHQQAGSSRSEDQLSTEIRGVTQSHLIEFKRKKTYNYCSPCNFTNAL